MLRRVFACCLAGLSFALASSAPAEAGKRLALVIGNDDYENVPKLLKAGNDARAVTQALSGLGFDVVSAEDVGRCAMSRALVDEQKKLLEQFWTGWVAFREWQGMNVYFTHLVTYRCAIGEVCYGFDQEAPDKVFALPPCDPSDPHSVPHEAVLHLKVPPKTGAMSVPLTYADGTQSEIKLFNAPK